MAINGPSRTRQQALVKFLLKTYTLVCASTYIIQMCVLHIICFHDIVLARAIVVSLHCLLIFLIIVLSLRTHNNSRTQHSVTNILFIIIHGEKCQKCMLELQIQVDCTFGGGISHSVDRASVRAGHSFEALCSRRTYCILY